MGHLAAAQSKMEVFALSVITLTLLLAAQQGQAKAVHAQVANINKETSAQHDGPNDGPGDDHADVKAHMSNTKGAPTQPELSHDSDDDHNANIDKDSQHEKDQKNDNNEHDQNDMKKEGSEKNHDDRLVDQNPKDADRGKDAEDVKPDIDSDHKQQGTAETDSDKDNDDPVNKPQAKIGAGSIEEKDDCAQHGDTHPTGPKNLWFHLRYSEALGVYYLDPIIDTKYPESDEVDPALWHYSDYLVGRSLDY